MREQGIETGYICMFSVVEPCLAPRVRGNKASKELELEMVPRRCVWIYHYWNDPQVGFGHTRLQTWLPLTVNICINGRHWLERQLIGENIDFVKDGNCFTHIGDFERARKLVAEQLKTSWPHLLNGLLKRNCPGIDTVLGDYPHEYYWTADETEWATDILFKSRARLDEIFPRLARYGLLVAQSPEVMRFLGRSDNRGRKPNEVVSDLRKRYEGLRLKHWVNRNSIKTYNKAGNVLRTETTINQTRDFKVYRHPDDDGDKPASWQKMRKGVCDLHRRAEISQASNERYLENLTAANIEERLEETLNDICVWKKKKGKQYRALNPWNPEDFKTLQFLSRGENQINGFRNKHLREAIYGASDDKAKKKRQSARVSRRLRLLRGHGIIRKAPRTNRYLLTKKGMKLAASVLAASSIGTQELMDMAA